MLITPQLKDKLLNGLVELDKIQINTSVKSLSDYIAAGQDVVLCLLDHFEHSGICSIKRYVGGNLTIILDAKAYDMQRRGGFTALEDLYQKQLVKLEKELEKLSKVFPDKTTIINTALATIRTVMSFF